MKLALYGIYGAALLTLLASAVQAESMNNEPDLPVAGRSLFDELTSDATGQRIIFPYKNLVAMLRARAGCAPDACTQQVLIPLGRSLQRTAAVGEYFRFPRVVTAFTGEASDGKQGYRPLLRDRLYLGYQEKTNVLEVISYNEAAGRFEFQLVHNYGIARTPQVVYAQRAVCLACHQNRGPIFSRPLWQETNANPVITARLRGELQHSHGVPLAASEDVPRAIQDASQRANRLQLAQAIWQAGCGTEATTARVCRAALLGAALRYRLSGGQGYDTRSLAEARRIIAARWRTQWPMGMRLLSSDLPSRVVDLSDVSGPTARRAIYIAPQFDPLAPRAVAATWTQFDAALEHEVVTTLAGFFSSADVRGLDQYLQRHAGEAANISMTLDCADAAAPHGPRQRVQFDCRNQQAQLSGRVYLGGAPDGDTLGTIDSMSTGTDQPWGMATLTAQAVQAKRVVLRATRDDMALRGVDGRALSAIELAWSGSKARLTIKLTEEIKLLDAAIDAAANQSDDGEAAPFNRNRALAAFDSVLNTHLATDCCRSLQPTAKPITDTTSYRRAAVVFDTWCATCHAGNGQFPPAFLRGTYSEVQSQLEQCAPRIYQRLSMWQLPPNQRNKTPMPPASVLPAEEASPQHLAYRREFKALAEWAEQVIRKNGGATAVLRGNDAAYELLPACVSSPVTRNLVNNNLVTQGEIAHERH